MNNKLDRLQLQMKTKRALYEVAYMNKLRVEQACSTHLKGKEAKAKLAEANREFNKASLSYHTAIQRYMRAKDAVTLQEAM